MAEFCEPRGAKKLGTDSIKTFAGAGDQGLVRRLIKMMVLFVVIKIQVNLPLYFARIVTGMGPLIFQKWPLL